MNRFSHIYPLALIVTGVTVSVVGGPIWGYPVAILFGFILWVFIGAYASVGHPENKSDRIILATFGLLAVAGGVTHVYQHGVSWFGVRGAATPALIGIACFWIALFPYVGTPVQKSE